MGTAAPAYRGVRYRPVLDLVVRVVSAPLPGGHRLMFHVKRPLPAIPISAGATIMRVSIRGDVALGTEERAAVGRGLLRRSAGITRSIHAKCTSLTVETLPQCGRGTGGVPGGWIGQRHARPAPTLPRPERHGARRRAVPAALSVRRSYADCFTVSIRDALQPWEGVHATNEGIISPRDSPCLHPVSSCTRCPRSGDGGLRECDVEPRHSAAAGQGRTFAGSPS